MKSTSLHCGACQRTLINNPGLITIEPFGIICNPCRADHIAGKPLVKQGGSGARPGVKQPITIAEDCRRNPMETTRCITLIDGWAAAVLYAGKCIENRNNKLLSGYYYLRVSHSNMPSSAKQLLIKTVPNWTPPPIERGSIIALVHIGLPVEFNKLSPEQAKWTIDHYYYHYPIKIVKTFTPIESHPVNPQSVHFEIDAPTLTKLRALIV